MPVNTYRSTDAGAPALSGMPGSLVGVLDACLVNGYGVAATATVTSNNTNVSDGDTVTVNGRVYTFKAGLTGANDEILIGGTADASLTNFVKLINLTGIGGTDYGIVSTVNTDVSAGAVIGHVVTLTAKTSGTVGNALTLAKVAATLTVSTFTGGSNTKTAAGWTVPYEQAGPGMYGTASTAVTGVAVATVTATMPAGINPGDLLLIYAWIYDSGAGSTTVNTPTGWTKLIDNGRFGRGPNLESVYIFYKVAPSGTNPNVVLTSTGNALWQVQVDRYIGVDPLNPIDVSAGAVSAAGLSLTAPAVTTSGINRRIVTYGVISNTTIVMTQPTNYVSRRSGNSFTTGANEDALADIVQAAAGGTGTLSWTIASNNGNTNYGITIALRPLAKTQAVYRGGSGLQHYFHVDDAPPEATALSKEAQFRGSEVASGFQAGITGYFPTTGQLALGAGLVARKSTTADGTARQWMVVADDRTCYVFVQTGDQGGTYYCAMFGETYSIMPSADVYRSAVIGRATVNSGVTTAENMGSVIANITQTLTGHYIARAYNGVGGAQFWGKYGDYMRGNIDHLGRDGLPVPNGPDGKLHLSPLHVTETSAGRAIRGRTRGAYQLCHAQTSFTDGDTIAGTGPYAGRTFLVVKFVTNVAGTSGALAFDITGPWETN